MQHLDYVPGAVAESVEPGPHVRKIMSSVPGRVKAITYKIDTCCFLAWHSMFTEQDKDNFDQCQDNMT